MKSIAIVLFGILLAATVAHAQADPDPDGIGIYADLEGTQVSISAEPGEIFPVYLLLTRPSSDDPLMAWSGQIIPPDNCQILGWNIQGGTYLNFANPPEFNVCFVDGWTPTPIMHLLTFLCRMTDDQAGYFRIVGSPLAGPGFDEWPCYIVESDIESAIPLHGYPDGIDEPMFAVNGDITPVESQSWTGVKNLFD